MDSQRLRRSLSLALCALAFSAWLHAAPRLRVRVQQAPLAGFKYHEAPRLWPQLHVGDTLDLAREPDNRFDARAIAVFWKGEKLGYLPRAENDAVSKAMDGGQCVEARIAALNEGDDPWKRMLVDVFLVSQ